MPDRRIHYIPDMPAGDPQDAQASEAIETTEAAGTASATGASATGASQAIEDAPEPMYAPYIPQHAPVTTPAAPAVPAAACNRVATPGERRPMPPVAPLEAHEVPQPPAAAHAPAPKPAAAPVHKPPKQAHTEQASKEAKEPKQSESDAPKKGKKRIWLFVALGVLVVLLGIGAKFLIDINNRAALFEQAPVTTPVPTPNATPEPGATPEPTPTPTPDPAAILLSQADLEFMKNRVNILVLGVDESTERANWGSFRTDTMILVTIDFETNDVHMISIPRDSYVKICGSTGGPLTRDGAPRYGKINSAFSAGGGAQENGYLYTMNTVSYLFGGIPVNYYVGFNMNVVKEVVNAMGGVDYDVDIEINMNGRHLDTGFQHLDGQAVLDYCRQRKGDSDIKRVERQQNMLKAIFRQLKTTGQIVNIPSIYKAVEANIQTNLSFTQISSLALMALDMDFDQLGSSTVEGTGIMVGSSSCWGLYMGKLETKIEELFGIDVRLDGDMNVSAIRERIAAEQAAIANELSVAKSALAAADSILSRYADWLTPDTAANLRAWRDVLEKSIEDASLANVSELVSATNSVNQLNNAILAQLGQHGEGGDIPQQPEVPDPAETSDPTEPTPEGDAPAESAEAGGEPGFAIPEVDPETGLPIG